MRLEERDNQNKKSLDQTNTKLNDIITLLQTTSFNVSSTKWKRIEDKSGGRQASDIYSVRVSAPTGSQDPTG